MKNSISTLSVKEIQSRVNNYGPYEWVNPSEVSGFDAQQLFQELKRRYFYSHDEMIAEIQRADNDDNDFYWTDPASIITDYLASCLIQKKYYEQKNEAVPHGLSMSSFDFIEAVVFLITSLGSSYAATKLAGDREAIQTDDVSACFERLKMIYEGTSELFVRQILNDFIIDFYQYGILWLDTSGLICYLTIEQINFLAYLDGQREILTQKINTIKYSAYPQDN